MFILPAPVRARRNTIIKYGMETASDPVWRRNHRCSGNNHMALYPCHPAVMQTPCAAIDELSAA
jgi:hypothetical protein